MRVHKKHSKHSSLKQLLVKRGIVQSDRAFQELSEYVISFGKDSSIFVINVKNEWKRKKKMQFVGI